MKPLIIFEGNDGTGKSTTAHAVANVLDLPVIHTSKPAPGVSAYHQYRRSVEHSWYTYPHGVIYDRFHLGERVYGIMHRGEDTLGFGGQEMLEAHMLFYWRPFIIICAPPMEVARTTWKARAAVGKEMFTDLHKWERAWIKYMVIKSDCPLIRYDYTKESVELLIDRIRRECKI